MPQCSKLLRLLRHLTTCKPSHQDLTQLLQQFDFAAFRSPDAALRKLSSVYVSTLLHLLFTCPKSEAILETCSIRVVTPLLCRGLFVYLSPSPSGAESLIEQKFVSSHLSKREAVLFNYAVAAVSQQSQQLVLGVGISKVLESLGSARFLDFLPDPIDTCLFVYAQQGSQLQVPSLQFVSLEESGAASEEDLRCTELTLSLTSHIKDIFSPKTPRLSTFSPQSRPLSPMKLSIQPLTVPSSDQMVSEKYTGSVRADHTPELTSRSSSKRNQKFLIRRSAGLPSNLRIRESSRVCRAAQAQQPLQPDTPAKQKPAFFIQLHAKHRPSLDQNTERSALLLEPSTFNPFSFQLLKDSASHLLPKSSPTIFISKKKDPQATAHPTSVKPRLHRSVANSQCLRGLSTHLESDHTFISRHPIAPAARKSKLRPILSRPAANDSPVKSTLPSARPYSKPSQQRSATSPIRPSDRS